MRSDILQSVLHRLFRFLTSRQFFTVAFGAILLVLLLNAYNAWLKPDRITVDSKDKTSPQYAYRKDELALLQIALNKLMEAETEKRYEDIYNDLGSRRFQKQVPERVFLKMANCVEQYLGDLVSYDRNNLGFVRKKRKGRTVDILQLHVERSEVAIEEQLVFEWDGVDARLGGLYWMTDRRPFHVCIREVTTKRAHLEDTGALQAVPESTEQKSTEINGQTQSDTSSDNQATTASESSKNTKHNQEASAYKGPDGSTGSDHKDSDIGKPSTTTLQQEAGEVAPGVSEPVSPVQNERIEPGESTKPTE